MDEELRNCRCDKLSNQIAYFQEQYINIINDIAKKVNEMRMNIINEIKKTKSFKDRVSSSAYYNKFKNNNNRVSYFSIYDIEWFFCTEEGQISWNSYYPMDEDDKITINGYYHRIL